MSWQWKVETDGLTHVWAATDGNTDGKGLSFADVPHICYYHRWGSGIGENLPSSKHWGVYGPPNGDGTALPTTWEIV